MQETSGAVNVRVLVEGALQAGRSRRIFLATSLATSFIQASSNPSFLPSGIQPNVSRKMSVLKCVGTASERPFKSTKNRFERGNVLYGKLRSYLDKVVVADTAGDFTTVSVPPTPTLPLTVPASEFSTSPA